MGTIVVEMGAHQYTDYTGMYMESATKPVILPNPFTNSLTISYSTDKAGTDLLYVFDNFNRLVAEPVNEFQPQKEQKIEWNSANLPAGVYYCRLQTDKQIATEKIIKAK